MLHVSNIGEGNGFDLCKERWRVLLGLCEMPSRPHTWMRKWFTTRLEGFYAKSTAFYINRVSPRAGEKIWATIRLCFNPSVSR